MSQTYPYSLSPLLHVSANENKCIYDKRKKKKTTEKQPTSRLGHKRTEDSSILGYYSLHSPEERSSNKRLVF